MAKFDISGAFEHIKSLAEGARAIADVYKAKRKLLDAQNSLQNLQKEHADHVATLEHRMQIERAYPRLVTEYTNTKDHRETTYKTQAEELSLLVAKKRDAEDRLQDMKMRHKQELAPFLELMNTTRERADDTARTLAEAKRLLKTSEQMLSAAGKRRQQRLDTVQKTLDATQERIARIKTSIASLSNNEDSIEPKKKLELELLGEESHLKSAQQDLQSVTIEAQRDIAQAQRQVEIRRHATDETEVVARAARQKADAHRVEYERLYNARHSEEDALQKDIASLVSEIETLEKKQNETKSQIDEVSEKLEEVYEIHHTPELTQNLATQIKQEEVLIHKQKAHTEALGAYSDAIAKHTRTSRIVFILVVFLVLVVFFFATYGVYLLMRLV